MWAPGGKDGVEVRYRTTSLYPFLRDGIVGVLRFSVQTDLYFICHSWS
jgi:hypothetical protein